MIGYAATPRQLEFLGSLVNERELPDGGAFELELSSIKAGDPIVLSKSQASEIIAYAMDLPRLEKPRTRVVRPGVYVTEGVGMVRVMQIAGSRESWSQLLDPSTRKWRDAPDALFAVGARDRMGAAEAHAWAGAEGLCPWCTDVLEPVHRNQLQNMGTYCARYFTR